MMILILEFKIQWNDLTQFFINTVNNGQLDGMGFTPFGEVEGNGLEVVKSLYSGYGEGAPYGRGPSQSKISREGNTYLKKDFPEMDYILKVALVKPVKGKE